ncbi:SMP-30/gluconolactonase/LRE family protein [Shewanella olleyana]|uniref:SMP-30/gluconolactonase/LRE family protein n=1 Tax=Shewanella olleyana TaxID=135626 RepID=UPI00200C5A8C|nr:SMP-30/gluconolactonase/LRE family protein [Shewanella olleyana]MCL1065626.1 SMP-30/gluconolactonase/LRE family protein [Shewanella olleyana]
MRISHLTKELTLWLIVVFILAGCSTKTISTSSSSAQLTSKHTETKQNHTATIEGIYQIYSPESLNVLDPNQPVKVLASGFEWVEGPVWSSLGNYLLFSDIPTHKVFKYDEQNGLSEYLSNSGFSNGLVIDQQNALVLLQSRSRQIAKMNASLSQPANEYEIIIDSYRNKRLNSPNDGVITANGSLFFTDPPYGLEGKLNDPAKELSFQGVYRLNNNHQLTLIDDTIVYPNGIALTKDERTLYVAASDPNKPAWYQYQLDENLQVTHKKVFYELPPTTAADHGLPDGLKIHPSGIIFATGPNGIFLFDKAAKLLAKIDLPIIAANLAFNGDYSKLYITAHQKILSINLKIMK